MPSYSQQIVAFWEDIAQICLLPALTSTASSTNWLGIDNFSKIFVGVAL
jgi:hypothetical protein